MNLRVQALAVWVTAISAEWMRLKHHDTQQSAAAGQMHAPPLPAGSADGGPAPRAAEGAAAAGAGALLAASSAPEGRRSSEGQPGEEALPDDVLLTWRAAPPARRLTADEASHADAVRGYTREALKGRTGGRRARHAQPPDGTPPGLAAPSTCCCSPAGS